MHSGAVRACKPASAPKFGAEGSARPAFLRASFSCVSPKAHGEIVVLEDQARPSEYLVGWRRDRRHRRNIVKLNIYSDHQSAISGALTLSCRYVPPVSPARNRKRDFQRSAIYRWERSIGGSEQRYQSIVEAEAEGKKIASHFQVRPVSIRKGRSNLINSSFFTARNGIVLCSRMMDSTTLLHEYSHYLVWRMRIDEASHGPAFAAVLITLHVLFSGTCPDLALKQALEEKIDVNTHLLDALLTFARSQTSSPL